MAKAIIMDFAGGSAEQYDRVIEQMNLGGKVAPGAVFHVAGPTDDGWRVVDVWDDMDAFGQFAETQIGPITQAEGLPEPKLQFVDLDEVLDQRGGGDGGITHFQVVHLDGMTKEQWHDSDRLIRGENSEPPDGCMFHVNGGTDAGWVVCDGWTSKEVRDQFIADKVMPAMQS